MAKVVAEKVFTSPKDPTVRIWRYIDFTKFVSMLDEQALYFARADQFRDDPFEGSVTEATRVQRRRRHQSLIPDDAAKKKEALVKTLGTFVEMSNKAMRRFVFLNCWHVGEYESAAMWKLYARSNEAVAIESTYEQLRGVLRRSSPRVHLGLVNYVDYQTASIPEGSIFWPFVHKRESFAHERELRALLSDLPEGESHWKQEGRRPRGHLVKVDLRALITRVWVAPTANRWFRHLVERMCSCFMLKKDVRQSDLDKDPVF